MKITKTSIATFFLLLKWSVSERVITRWKSFLFSDSPPEKLLEWQEKDNYLYDYLSTTIPEALQHTGIFILL